MKIELASTPSEEQCAQIGDENYAARAKLECKTFLSQIIRHYGNAPTGVKLVVSGKRHDSGTYYEVDIIYADTEAGIDYAFSVENDSENMLWRWDIQSRAELAAVGYFDCVDASVMA